MRNLILLTVALVLALLASVTPPASAFHSPIYRPTLDPAWVCLQLGNCPQPPHREGPHVKTGHPRADVAEPAGLGAGARLVLPPPAFWAALPAE